MTKEPELHRSESNHEPGRRLLILVAAPGEARAVRSPWGLAEADRSGAWVLERGPNGLDLLETGVGKSQAAGAAAWAFDRERHAGVIGLGVAGALPGAPLDLGSIVLGTRSVFADEGLATPEGFRTLADMGFPPGRFDETGPALDPAWRRALRPLADAEGVIATVSTCAGTDAAAREAAARTGAVAEAMEGAAVAAALSRLPADAPLRFAELRVISNTTGDRGRQRWDLEGALARLATLAGALRGVAGELCRG